MMATAADGRIAASLEEQLWCYVPACRGDMRLACTRLKTIQPSEMKIKTHVKAYQK